MRPAVPGNYNNLGNNNRRNVKFGNVNNSDNNRFGNDSGWLQGNLDFMKTYGHLYSRLCDYNNLFLAFQKAKQRKAKKEYVIAFLDCTPPSVQPDKAKMLAKNKVVTWGVAYEKDDIFERNQDIRFE